jgi:hypothetical protein
MMYMALCVVMEASGLSLGGLQPVILHDNDHSSSCPLQAFNTSSPELKFLDLSSNMLTGTLPGTWGTLAPATTFDTISLASNFFNGSVPDSWDALLGSTVNLLLASNHLQGSLPASWAALAAAPAELVVVELAGNPCLCGPPPAWFNENNSVTSGTGLGTDCLSAGACVVSEPAALASVDAAGE